MKQRRLSEGNISPPPFHSEHFKSQLALPSLWAAWGAGKLPRPQPETPTVHFPRPRLALEWQFLWQGASRCHRARTTAHATNGHYRTRAESCNMDWLTGDSCGVRELEKAVKDWGVGGVFSRTSETDFALLLSWTYFSWHKQWNNSRPFTEIICRASTK